MLEPTQFTQHIHKYLHERAEVLCTLRSFKYQRFRQSYSLDTSRYRGSGIQGEVPLGKQLDEALSCYLRAVAEDILNGIPESELDDEIESHRPECFAEMLQILKEQDEANYGHP